MLDDLGVQNGDNATIATVDAAVDWLDLQGQQGISDAVERDRQDIAIEHIHETAGDNTYDSEDDGDHEENERDCGSPEELQRSWDCIDEFATLTDNLLISHHVQKIREEVARTFHGGKEAENGETTSTNRSSPNLRSGIRRRRRALGRPLFNGRDEHEHAHGNDHDHSYKHGHGHDGHTHGPVQDVLPGLSVVPIGGVGGGKDAIKLPILDPAHVEGLVGRSSGNKDRNGAEEHVHAHLHEAQGNHAGEHGHHHSHAHGLAGHSHTHFHVNVRSLKSRRTVIRLFVATVCVLALPLWRRSSRLEWAALGGVSLFLAAVDMGKLALNRIRSQFGLLYSGWKAHADLASSTHQSRDAVTKESVREVDIVTWIGVLVNVGLAGFKFVAGMLGNSAAMIADAGHSLSDLLSDGVTLWAVRLSRLPPDDDHQYGHGRFEAVGAFMIALMLMGAGYSIGNHSFETLVEVANPASRSVPTRLTALAATISIVAKEALFRATLAVGQRRNSQVLIANAWHHRTDAVSSVVALLAILGSMCGAPILDPIAGLMVAGMVALTGVQVCVDSMAQLTDATDYDVRRNVASIARQIPGVVSFNNVRARRMGPKTLVDLTIQTENKISASSAQQVGQRVRWKILEQMPQVADVLVNIAVERKPCPVLSSLRLQDEIEQDIRSVVMAKLPEITDVPKIMVHYINMVVTAEVFIRVNPNLRVSEVSDIARRARYALSSGIDDLCSAEVHLDLVEHYL